MRFQRYRSHRGPLRGVCLFFWGSLTDWLLSKFVSSAKPKSKSHSQRAVAGDVCGASEPLTPRTTRHGCLGTRMTRCRMPRLPMLRRCLLLPNPPWLRTRLTIGALPLLTGHRRSFPLLRRCCASHLGMMPRPICHASADPSPHALHARPLGSRGHTTTTTRHGCHDLHTHHQSPLAQRGARCCCQSVDGMCGS